MNLNCSCLHEIVETVSLTKFCRLHTFVELSADKKKIIIPEFREMGDA
jgi:hypothetical protein